MSWGYQTRKGEQAPNAKLSKALIDTARALREKGYTWEEIAERCGVHYSTIRRAVLGQSYQD